MISSFSGVKSFLVLKVLKISSGFFPSKFKPMSQDLMHVCSQYKINLSCLIHIGIHSFPLILKCFIKYSIVLAKIVDVALGKGIPFFWCSAI
ncbi:hypothetical protein AQUCO_07800027v1 [Aquilegia coerulea]|uniref:Uncharacterized protein n=1 Tax=Aquilegia coerulea TaxID=218851 RepID=A0A2G5C7X1_AQUCA|nr:hypothetical protein AQUCO_07800027v1 [Aquilegia coerulea]